MKEQYFLASCSASQSNSPVDLSGIDLTEPSDALAALQFDEQKSRAQVAEIWSRLSFEDLQHIVMYSYIYIYILVIYVYM